MEKYSIYSSRQLPYIRYNAVCRFGTITHSKFLIGRIAMLKPELHPIITIPRFYIRNGCTRCLQFPDREDVYNPFRYRLLGPVLDHYGEPTPEKIIFDHMEEIKSCLAGLYQCNHELKPAFPTLTREVVSTTFKNGKLRKYPILKIVEEMSNVENRWEVCRQFTFRMEEAARYVTHNKTFSRWLGARANIVMNMASDYDNELTFTISPPKQYGVIIHSEWKTPVNYSGSRYTTTIFRDEILQFFPPSLLVEYLPRHSEFKWIYRWGFCDEFHCPSDYWQLNKYRLILMQLTDQFLPDLIVRNTLDGSISKGAYLEWYNVPMQPISKIVLTDTGESFLPPIIDDERLEHFPDLLPLIPREISFTPQPEGILQKSS